MISRIWLQLAADYVWPAGRQLGNTGETSISGVSNVRDGTTLNS
jgi:hypothetical protein